MPVKGACKDPPCCCDACEAKLLCDTCCRCIPRYICVSIDFPDNPYCDPEDQLHVWDPVSETYLGPDVGGVDVKISFLRVADECYLVLESAACGLIEDNRLFERIYDCATLQHEFVLPAGCTAEECGQAIIGVSRADFAIMERGCNRCPNCHCFCRCLCFTFVDLSDEVDACFVREEVCNDQESYEGSIASWTWTVVCRGESRTFAVSLSRDEDTGRCMIGLTTTGTVHDGPFEAQCPAIGAGWRLGPEGAEDSVFVTVSCRACQSCLPFPDCEGQCQWEWSGSFWFQNLSCGPGPCLCTPPDRDGDFTGEAVFTQCFDPNA